MNLAPASAISRRGFLLAGGALALCGGRTRRADADPEADEDRHHRLGPAGRRHRTAVGQGRPRDLVLVAQPEPLKDLVAQAGPKARAGTPAEAATFGDVVLIAVPYGALPQVGKDYAHLMKGKIVIDVGNPRVDRDGEVGKDGLARGTGVTSKEHLPGVRLVRALNALSFTQVAKDAHRAGEKLGIPIAGDDKAAIAVTVQLVHDAGFDPVVVGGLARAKEFDAGTPVYVKGMTAAQLKAALKLP